MCGGLLFYFQLVFSKHYGLALLTNRLALRERVERLRKRVCFSLPIHAVSIYRDLGVSIYLGCELLSGGVAVAAFIGSHSSLGERERPFKYFARLHSICSSAAFHEP